MERIPVDFLAPAVLRAVYAATHNAVPSIDSHSTLRCPFRSRTNCWPCSGIAVGAAAIVVAAGAVVGVGAIVAAVAGAVAGVVDVAVANFVGIVAIDVVAVAAVDGAVVAVGVAVAATVVTLVYSLVIC